MAIDPLTSLFLYANLSYLLKANFWRDRFFFIKEAIALRFSLSDRALVDSNLRVCFGVGN